MGTEVVVVHTADADSEHAGQDLAAQISAKLGSEPPDALIVFASSRYDYVALLGALDASCGPKVMIGCSSAGEFISSAPSEGSACAIAFRSSTLRFASGLGHGLREDPESAAQELVASFGGLATNDYAYRTALVMSDALAGHADDLVEHLTLQTAGTYQFFGGGAGDDAQFQRTHVFHGTEAHADAVVALEILSNSPVGVGVAHGWEPAGPPMRVTEADGMRLIGVNAAPAVEAFQEYAEATGQSFDLANPLPFLLHNIIGIDTGDEYRLRVPLGVESDGSILCAADVPVGATVRIMSATSESSTQAASRAVSAALAPLCGQKPAVALVFDCVATRLRTGREFGFELEAVEDLLGDTQFAGCNTYGQIARTERQFNGFHNCTAVVCVIPES
ncbi:MAG: FIST C-terminal domain-containing protein [Chloroflexota bacterium]|nr:FIST C-terminal domain-containing protein [Chloroflexota bacterium]